MFACQKHLFSCRARAQSFSSRSAWRLDSSRGLERLEDATTWPGANNWQAVVTFITKYCVCYVGLCPDKIRNEIITTVVLILMESTTAHFHIRYHIIYKQLTVHSVRPCFVVLRGCWGHLFTFRCLLVTARKQIEEVYCISGTFLGTPISSDKDDKLRKTSRK